MSINKLVVSAGAKPNVLADFYFVSLGEQLGGLIQSSLDISNVESPEELIKKEEVIKKVFNQFINQKISTVKDQIQQLINYQCISNVHYSMTLYMVFFTYLDELIAHYQLGLEQRDEELDEQLQSIKWLAARSRSDLWNRNPKELETLILKIKNKLDGSDILPPKFDETISLWTKMLQVQHVGELNLAQLYDKDFKSASLRNKKNGVVKMARRDLEQAYALVLGQFDKDCAWISKRMQEKMPALPDKNLEKIFSLLIANSNYSPLTPVFTQHQHFIESSQLCLKTLYLLTFNDNELMDGMKKCLELLSNLGDMPPTRPHVELLLAGIPLEIIDENGMTLMVSEETFPGITWLLVNYCECDKFVRFFLLIPMYFIQGFLSSFIRSNELWENRNNVEPLFASDTASLLPPPFVYNEHVIDSLLEDLASIPPAKVGKKGNTPTPAKKRNQKNKKQPVQIAVKSQPQKKLKQQLKSERQVPSVPLTLISGDTVQTSSIERLRAKLSHYCEITRSPALRQALWHLDALTAFQTSFDRSPLQAKECLAIACGVASCAQKVLEQTYRSLLLKKGVADLPTSHNLLHYHREFDPNFENCPEVVKKLSSANNWCRYFYLHEANLRTMSTRVVRIPPILSLFVQMAEGKTFSPAVLREFVDETIERASLHAENLLEGLDISSSSSLPPIPKAPIAADSHVKIGVNGAAVSRALQNFLNRSHLNSRHPAYLYIKQALAALKMLEVSLQKMNKAEDLHALSAWNIWATQQLQESMEHVLRAIQYFQNGAVTIDHEMGKLAQDVGLEMEGLAEAYHHLSYKTRYPAEFIETTPLAESIDDLEFLKHHPEIMEGYTVKQPTTLLWKMPSENASLERIWEKLVKQIVQWEGFLLNKAIPLLENCVEPRRAL
jgi:hypothetical protein